MQTSKIDYKISQNNKFEAKTGTEIYKNILKQDPSNKDALSAINRLSGLRKERVIKNEQMKEFFIRMKSDEEINEFKRWLIRL